MAETTKKNTMSEALVKALSEITNPERTGLAKVKTQKGDDYSYRYAQLPEILNAARPIFAKHGLAIMQDVASENGSVMVRTIVIHESGEKMESSFISLPAGGTPQATGSATTYARRYSLTAFLGVAGEDDDDAQAAEHQAPTAPTPQRAEGPRTPGGATVKQVGFCKKLFVDAGIARAGAKDEDDEAKQVRRDDNMIAVYQWLQDHHIDAPDGTDPLEQMSGRDISEVIDTLKAEMEERQNG